MKKQKSVWDNPVYRFLCDYHRLITKDFDRPNKTSKAVWKEIRKLERQFRVQLGSTQEGKK